MPTLSKFFTIYLKTKGASQATVKNYVSDLKHFSAWADLYSRSRNHPFSFEDPKIFGQSFKVELVERYKEYLVLNNIPLATANRRLSTLRAFAKFSLTQAWIIENPTTRTQNIVQTLRIGGQQSTINNQQLTINNEVLSAFKKHLENEKTSSGRSTSHNTIKSYLSDIREFLNFLNQFDQ